MILAAFVAAAIQQLKQAGIDNPQLDARLLICHALKCSRADLLSQSQRVLTENEIISAQSLLDRRAKREPVARIIGSREFWGLEFGLNEATLEPRPDSETLIEAILSSFRRKPESRLKSHFLDQRKEDFKLDSGLRRNDGVRILDLGTGTGCLLLALLHELPQATGLGLDINPRAVEQATQNANALGLGNRAAFIVSDWFAEIKNQKFDIILSNPPYIPDADIRNLMPEVRDYDPMLALNGGDAGLAPYRIIIPQLADFLNPQGIVAFEVGIRQAQQVVDLFLQCGFADIEIHKDLGSIERCITAHKICS